MGDRDRVPGDQVHDPRWPGPTGLHPTGVEQEIYALLVAYQMLRTAMLDATDSRDDVDPDRASFTIALHRP